MDFNDIDNRIQRLYSSIEVKFDENIHKYIDRKIISNNKIFGIDVSFNRQKEVDSLSKIISIIHNLANFKDHLKKRVSQAQIIEDEINNSLFLQLIIDLANQDKHGYPLTKFKRSHKDPIIDNVRSMLQLVTDPNNKSSAMTITSNGKINTIGKQRISIEADINDGNGNFICTLDELINKAVVKWEDIIKTNALI